MHLSHAMYKKYQLNDQFHSSMLVKEITISQFFLFSFLNFKMYNKQWQKFK